MGNWKSRSDDQIWWESQPGNRGKTYPGDSIASKQYERDKAAGENNLSIIKSLFNKLPKPRSKVDIGPSDRDPSEYKRGADGFVSLDEEPGVTSKKKGGSISLKNCKVTTHAKNKKQSDW